MEVIESGCKFTFPRDFICFDKIYKEISFFEMVDFVVDEMFIEVKRAEKFFEKEKIDEEIQAIFKKFAISFFIYYLSDIKKLSKINCFLFICPPKIKEKSPMLDVIKKNIKRKLKKFKFTDKFNVEVITLNNYKEKLNFLKVEESYESGI